MTDHGWIDGSKPRSPAPPARRLGTGKAEHRADARPIPLPDDTEKRQMAHARCSDHVKVDGLRRPVCVAEGQDVDEAVAEARELAGLS